MSENKEKDTKKFVVTDRRGEDRKADPTPQAEPKATPKTAPPRKIDFSTFIISMSTSALVHMGVVEDPISNKKEKKIEMARQDIDLIEMFEEKTKGNLTAAETQLIEQVLYELRVKFVEASR